MKIRTEKHVQCGGVKGREGELLMGRWRVEKGD
jgi:hypothetical protein